MKEIIGFIIQVAIIFQAFMIKANGQVFNKFRADLKDTIQLSSQKEYLVLIFDLKKEITGRSIVFGYTTNEKYIPKSLAELLNDNRPLKQFDVDSCFSQEPAQRVYVSKTQLGNADKIYIYVIYTNDEEDNSFYDYTIQVKSYNEISCRCQDDQVCSCLSHGVVKCMDGYIGNRCEQESYVVEKESQQFVIKQKAFFYLDATDPEKIYQMGIKVVDPNIKYDLQGKYYNLNSSVIPNQWNSQLVFQNQQSSNIDIFPQQNKTETPLYFNRILMKLENLSVPAFRVQITLDTVDREGSENDNTIVVIILISVSIFVLFLLVLAVLYIIKLNKKDRILQEQNRLQRMRNQQRQNTTMGDEDLKRYMPAILYKNIKDQLLKVSKQEDAGACVVCLCDFEDEENVRSTYCKHVFHSECLTDWMKKNESCPYCRTALNKDNIVEIYEKYKSNSLMWLDQENILKENSKDIVEEKQMEGEQQCPSNKKEKEEQNQIFIVSRNRSLVEIKQEPEAVQNMNKSNINLGEGGQEGSNRDKRSSVQQQSSSHRSSIKQTTIIKDDIIQLQKLNSANNKEPRSEVKDFIVEDLHDQQQQVQTSQRSQEGHNFQSSENVQTIHKFNNECSDHGQFGILSNTPGRDNSIVDYRRNLSTEKNDSFLNEGQTSSKRNIIINQVKNSQFKNAGSSDKKSEKFIDQEQSYNQDNSPQFNAQIFSIDPNSIYDNQVEKINADFMQSEHSTYLPRESEDIFGGGSVRRNSRRLESGLQVIYSESSSPDKLYRPTQYSFRQPQSTTTKRRNNSKKNTQVQNPQGKNTMMQSIYRKEENKELRQSLKDFNLPQK